MKILIVMAVKMQVEIKDEQLIKKAIVELLKEKNEYLLRLIKDTIEDYALGEAINEGLKYENVSKEEVFKELTE
jgi:hypothetical protein